MLVAAALRLAQPAVAKAASLLHAALAPFRVAAALPVGVAHRAKSMASLATAELHRFVADTPGVAVVVEGVPVVAAELASGKKMRAAARRTADAAAGGAAAAADGVRAYLNKVSHLGC